METPLSLKQQTISKISGDTSQISSAARSILISLPFIGPTEDGHGDEEAAIFHPVYTHQLFSGENIPGYQPRRDLLPVEYHLGHSDGIAGSSVSELLIQVVLAPSCLCCMLTIEIKEIEKVKETHSFDDSEEIDSLKRKRKVDTFSDSPHKIKTPDISACRKSSDVDQGTQAKLEYFAAPPLSAYEIKVRLEKALPPIKTDIPEIEMFLSEPIGTIQKEFSVKRGVRKEMDLIVTIASGAEAFAYHEKVQKLARLFIESADDVDLQNKDDVGHWKLLYVFRKHILKNCDNYSFVGYMTLYHFQSPFRKPKPGVVVRICQALIIPPYQRLGIGRTMQHAVYESLVQNQQSSHDDDIHSIVEINVEDPGKYQYK
jgi:histone acetyltransferase 1